MELLYGSTGSANQANISPAQIKSIKIVVPSRIIVTQFESTIRAIRSNIKFQENQTLKTLQSLLLSKLAGMIGDE